MPTPPRFPLPSGLALTLSILALLFHLPATTLDLPIQQRLLHAGERFAQSSEEQRQAAIEEFEATVEQTVQRNGMGSAVVGIVLDGHVAWKKGFGSRDIEKKMPADADGIYRVGSITKSFTAMAMVQLAEKGVFALDDPVYKYFPEIEGLAGKNEYAKSITFRHLASHTAGLAKEPKLAGAASGPIGQWEEKILASIPKTEILTPPGQRHHYSNIGFGILGLAVSRAAGQPYMGLVEDLILQPLGMKHSAFIPTEEMEPLVAAGIQAGTHGTLDTETPKREHIGRGYKVPNGGLYTTLDDLGRFIALHCNDGRADVMYAEAVKQMRRIQATPDGRSLGPFEKAYGLGLWLFTAPDGTRLVGHFGSVSGYDSTMYFHPETKTGVILLRSYHAARGKEELRLKAVNLLRSLVAITGGEAARQPRDTLTLGGKEVYEGRRILLDEDSYPRSAAKLVEGPTARREGDKIKIAFALDNPDDVLVRVLDARGRSVRNLACGVLGKNAPEPFQKGSLRQEIVWDGKAVHGEPAGPGWKIQVAVGLTPRFDGFVAHDPEQLLTHVCGLEVDGKGRVYVSLFTERRGDTEVRRYDRQGTYLETVYPPNPHHLQGKLEDVFAHYDYVDAQAVPRRRGAWPFFIYKYHSGHEANPIDYPFPLRITPDGRAYIAEIVTAHSGLTPSEVAAIKPVKSRIFAVELDPFWFLKRMSMGAGAWAVDDKGYAYLCCTNRTAVRELGRIDSPNDEKLLGNTVVKLALETMRPAADFQYNGREKLPEKRPYLGTFRKTGEGPEFFQNVHDLTVDRQGNLYVVDQTRIKMYRPNGRFVKVLNRFELDGRQMEFGAVHGVRAANGALYVVARMEPIMGAKGASSKGWRTAQLVKFKLAPQPEPEAVWTLPLDGLASLVAVDEGVEPPIVWVAGGGGPGTFTRIIDEKVNPGPVRHIGGIRKGVLIDPWSVAVDADGRVFTFDYARGRIVRTNEDGADWLESQPVDRVMSLHIDRKRGRLYRSSLEGIVCSDLEFNDLEEIEFSPGMMNLGAVDADGNLYVTTSGQTSLGKPLNPVVNRFGPDGLNGLVHLFGPDGKLLQPGLIEHFQGLGGLAMDSKGCIYVMDTCRGQFQFVAHDVGRRLLEGWPLWERGNKTILNQSDLGYLVKFAPGGGKRCTDAELWAHRGASPIMSQCRCPVVTNTVAVDAADRVFATDYLKYHIKVFDTAGNLIARIGAWGSADCRGPHSRYAQPEIPFDWVHSLDVLGDALYASDKQLRRIVKVRLDYRHLEETSVP